MKAQKKEKSEIRFPKKFLWGTATAPTQIDGGDPASDWYEFCRKKGNILDGSSSITGCDHWNRFEDDFKLMHKLGLNAYRFGIDWSRLEPEPGRYNTAALDHVRKMLSSLKKKKIRPLLTLNHFAVPTWWAKKGGWSKHENLADLYRYVDFAVSGIGDLVEDYITINEPVVYCVQGFMDGIWPPGRSGLFGYLEAMKVQRHMVQAHFEMYDTIRQIHGQKNFKSPKISIAKHLRVFDPKDPASPLDVDRAKAVDYRFNRLFCQAIHTGELNGPLGKGEKIHDGKGWDFVGVNYYSRNIVNFNLLGPHRLFMDTKDKEGTERNDLGWEIYPEGLTRLLLEVQNDYGLPIRVTENGIADATDEKRTQFIQSHIRALHDAIAKGVNVEGYYHWSFLDNFEWAEGYTARFGLVEVDFKTQKRTPRKSATLFSKLAKTGILPK